MPTLPARAQTVCTYWLRGLCMKGDQCGFLHQFATDRMPVCRNLLKHGECKDQASPSPGPPLCRAGCLCNVCLLKGRMQKRVFMGKRTSRHANLTSAWPTIQERAPCVRGDSYTRVTLRTRAA